MSYTKYYNTTLIHDMDTFQLIDNSELLIHSTDSEFPVEAFDTGDSSHFGIIKIKMKHVKVTQQPLFLLFTIDRTYSMEESDIKMISKMNQVKQTFKNVIHYLSNQDLTVYICVNVFNETVDTLIDVVLINNDNISNLIQKIDELSPDGLTNIGDALISATQILNTYSAENPTHQIGHIFMTDGEPTIGIRNGNELSNYVNYTYTNTFIGYGVDHNACLLRELCEHNNADYLFVDKTENTSFVYGEAIHKFLYPAIKNVTIQIDNGYIYNWRSNKWVTELNENVFVGEIEKIYNIKTADYEHVNVTIWGKYGTHFEKYGVIDRLYPLPPLITPSGDIIPSVIDLTNHIFRQKVMELLFYAKKNLHHKNELSIKSKIKELFKQLKRFIQDNDYENDAFMKTLCDDLSIVYNTIGGEYGNTYAISRHSAQCGQQSYNTSSPFIKPPKLKRYDQFAHMPQQPHNTRDNAIYYNIDENNLFENDSFDDIEHNLVSDEVTNHYATPSMLRTMNSISQPI